MHRDSLVHLLQLSEQSFGESERKVQINFLLSHLSVEAKVVSGQVVRHCDWYRRYGSIHSVHEFGLESLQ